jgi:hypothetical protein
VSRALAGVLLLAALVAGCGTGDPPLPDRLAGRAVGAMAERQLETQNPRMARGTMACPDLDLRVGASVRCLRTTELSGGRVVRVAGTVRVTSTGGGGRLHVAMDEQARSFGLTGDQVAAGAREQYAGRHHVTPTSADCPDLEGRVGAVVACRLQVSGRTRIVDAVVTSVDRATYTTRFVVRRHRGE